MLCIRATQQLALPCSSLAARSMSSLHAMLLGAPPADSSSSSSMEQPKRTLPPADESSSDSSNGWLQEQQQQQQQLPSLCGEPKNKVNTCSSCIVQTRRADLLASVRLFDLVNKQARAGIRMCMPRLVSAAVPAAETAATPPASSAALCPACRQDMCWLPCMRIVEPVFRHAVLCCSCGE
jgi:hypothetical protein